MKVDERLVKRIGSVMKLDITDEDMKQFAIETKDTLSMLERLNELDTEGVEPTFYGGPSRTARFREDKAVRDEQEVAALLENTPNSVDQLIEVPAILDDGEGGA